MTENLNVDVITNTHRGIGARDREPTGDTICENDLNVSLAVLAHADN